MTTIYENKERILSSDIPFEIGRAILFVVISYLVSRIRFTDSSNKNENIRWIFWGGLFLLFLFLIFTTKTIKRIEKTENGEKLRFIFDRRLRSELIREFNISELRTDLKKQVARGIVTYILKISDGKNKLKIKTGQKGITKKELDLIHNEIKKHYTQQWL